MGVTLGLDLTYSQHYNTFSTAAVVNLLVALFLHLSQFIFYCVSHNIHLPLPVLLLWWSRYCVSIHVQLCSSLNFCVLSFYNNYSQSRSIAPLAILRPEELVRMQSPLVCKLCF